MLIFIESFSKNAFFYKKIVFSRVPFLIKCLFYKNLKKFYQKFNFKILGNECPDDDWGKQKWRAIERHIAKRSTLPEHKEYEKFFFAYDHLL